MIEYDKRKQSLYLPDDLLADLSREAARLDRSMSWVIQYGMRHGGLAALRKIPSLPEVVK